MQKPKSESIRKAITKGCPLPYADVVKQITISSEFGLKLFKWNRDFIYSIITAETLRQFLSILKKFNIKNCHEVFAGSGLMASCLSQYADYEASDNHSYTVKKYYYPVKKLNYSTAIARLRKPTLIIAVLPVGSECIEVLINSVTKTKPLWLVVYAVAGIGVKDMIQSRGLSVIRLKHTIIVPGDMWDEKKHVPGKKHVENSCLNLVIYKL